MDLKNAYDAVLAADAKRQAIAGRINKLFDDNKIEDAQKLQPELAQANAEYKAANALYLELADTSHSTNPAARFVPAGQEPEPKQTRDMRASPEYLKVFFDALRVGATPKAIQNGQFRAEHFKMLMDAITETGGTPAGSEGGFLNPVEFDNKIHELMRDQVDLGAHVNVEPVTAYSGWRVVETAKAAQPLTPMTEMDVKTDDEEGESPTFTKVEYTVHDYGDFLRVSNDQLADTPVNIMNYLARWFSRKVVLTNNYYILAKINALSPTSITDPALALAGIKTAFNKTLDPAFSASAEIFTNQTGLDILDQLDDGTGRPLLQPDPTNPTAFRVKGRPVVFLSDAQWANVATPTRARIAIGDGREFVTLFARMAFEFASTTIGGAAWRSNSTEVRGIARLDVETVDSGAMCLLRVNEVKA